MVEIQLRTRAQHRWAQVSERLADRLGLAVKYGGGPRWAIEALMSYSATVKQTERLEYQHRQMLDDAYDLRQHTSDAATATERGKLIADAEELETRVHEQRPVIDRELEEIAALIEKRTRDHEVDDDFLD